MGAPLLIEQLRAQLGGRVRLELLDAAATGAALSTTPTLSLSWPEFDAVLPDGGLPHGVVELTAPHLLGGVTLVALAAVSAAQKREPRTWCAWLDPEATLYAPGVAMAGVELKRLLVVRPPRAELARIALKVARSAAFDVIVIDGDVLGGDTSLPAAGRNGAHYKNARAAEVFVRKLSLLAAEAGATILLLTDGARSRPAPLPVVLRLELSRTSEMLNIKIGKDRLGRVGLAKTVALATRPLIELAG